MRTIGAGEEAAEGWPALEVEGDDDLADGPGTSPATPGSASSFHGRPHQKIHVDLDKLRRRFLMARKRPSGKGDGDGGRPRIEQAEEETDEPEGGGEAAKREIERKLARMLSKSDFARMRLVDQFNNAFLLVRLGPRLFIVDQHAADEKFNFEQLQARALVKPQQLIEPLALQLGSLNAALLRDNLGVFHSNGFQFQFGQEAAEEDGPESDGCPLVLLTSTPNISGCHFDQHDIDQLLSLLSEVPGQLHRPNKVRALFASRACRRSVMFGQALGESKMEEIVRNMGRMEAPWNCPHGRPTIRHLCTIHVPGEEEEEEEEEGTTS